MIDVSNLHTGLVVKGYKGMCAAVGDEYKGTNTKGISYQKKDWQRYFEWIEHTSRKWEVNQIFEQVKEKQDGRRNNKGGAKNIVYADHIDVLMLEYLNKNEVISDTFRFFREQFGLRHEEYDRLYNEIPELAEELEIDEWYLWDFLIYTKRQAVNVIDGCLKRISKTECIGYEKDLMAGKYIKGFDNKIWQMSDEDKYKLDKIKFDLLQDMQAKSEQQIIYEGRYFQYKDELDNQVSKELGIDFMYNRYIVVTMPFKFGALDDLLGQYYEKYFNEDEDEIDHFRTLNDKMCDKIIDSAMKRHLKAVEKAKNPDAGFGWLDIDEATKRRADKKYIDVYKRLVKHFIRVNDEGTNNLMEAIEINE